MTAFLQLRFVRLTGKDAATLYGVASLSIEFPSAQRQERKFTDALKSCCIRAENYYERKQNRRRGCGMDVHSSPDGCSAAL
jgi:hypothetical protein